MSHQDREQLIAEAESRYERGDLEGALQIYRRLCARFPGNARILNDTGTVRFALGHARRSLDLFVRALRAEPSFPEARQNLRAVCRSLGITPDTALRRAGVGAAPATRLSRDISVVVPVHSEFDALDRCLDALHAQSFDAERFEVVAVANGVTGDDEERLEEAISGWKKHFTGRLQCHSLQEASIARARNEGVRRSQGRLVLQINEDTVLSRSALAQHFAEHESLGFSPRCVVTGGRKFGPAYLRSLFNYLHESVPLYTPLHRPRPRFLGDHTWFITCNLSALREAYERFGMYDPSFKWGSDQRLGRRWEEEHNVRVYVNTNIVGYHLHRITFESWKDKIIDGAPHWFRRNMGMRMEEMPSAGRRAVREELDDLPIDPDAVEEEFRRLEANFEGPGSYAGDTVMGRPAPTVEDLTHLLRPLIREYRKYLQYSEMWRRAEQHGGPEEPPETASEPGAADSIAAALAEMDPS